MWEIHVKRMPVRLIEGGKCPGDALRGQSLLHVLVFEDIAMIVKVYEIVVPHAAVGDDGNQRKNGANSGNLPRLSGRGRHERDFPDRRHRCAIVPRLTDARFFGRGCDLCSS